MGFAQTTSLVLNAIISALSIGAWMQLMLSAGTGRTRLASRGLSSLRYFTVLSNLLSCLVSALCVASLLGGAASLAPWLLALRLTAASAVMLTFLVVIALLNPIYGWRSMYASGNLWLHLVLPLLAALDCCLFQPVGTLPLWVTPCVMVPTALYAVWYLGCIRRYGAERDGVVYDFYGFLRWGEDRIPVVTASMLGITWLIGLLLCLASRILFLG